MEAKCPKYMEVPEVYLPTADATYMSVPDVYEVRALSSRCDSEVREPKIV